jgi:hypothetical protein
MSLIVMLRLSLIGAALMVMTVATRAAENCSLEIGGKTLWNGKCCVDVSALDLGKQFAVTVRATGWRACLYEKKHPEDASKPTVEQTCLGPWINIDQDTEGNTWSAYWSLKDYCHADAQDRAEAITKSDQGTFEGNNFRFSWTAQ